MAKAPARNQPVKIFISYSHLDDKFRAQLGQHLTPLEHNKLIDVWHDRRISPGTEWANEIDDKINSSKIILLLIYINFINSTYCYGIEMERALERHANREARVIPIILSSSDWQSLSFGKLNALPEDGRPVASFRDRDTVFMNIAKAIRGVVEELKKAAPSPASPPPEPTPAPSPVAVILETGAMPVDSPFYVLRHADNCAARCLASSNPTLIVKASRQSGKSSLLNRLHFGAIEEGGESCYLNFEDLDESTLASPERLLPALARMMADSLETDAKPDDFWSDRHGPKENLLSFVEKKILEPNLTSVQLVFDEVDIIARHPESSLALFSMLRSWHNRRSTDTKGRWKKFRLVIAHATDPTLWIPNLNQSPFNVGLNITLEDFDEQNVTDLNGWHGGPLNNAAEIRMLMALVGGHPFFVRLSLYALAMKQRSLPELVNSANANDGPFADYLNKFFRPILHSAELRSALHEVLDAGTCQDEGHFQRLWAEGVVRGPARSAVKMRCQLFEQYLKRRL